MIKSAFAICAALLLISSCSMPKIIVLKDPLTPEEHISLGMAYEKKKEYDIAIKEYEAAVMKVPRAKLYLANARFLNNQPDKAEELYRQVLQDDPKCANAYNNLAWLLYIQKKNLPEARAFAQKAMELDPQHAEYPDTLNRIELEMRKQKNIDGR